MDRRDRIALGAGKAARSAARIPCTITYLEMMQAPDLPPLHSPKERIALLRAENPSVSFYRFLYDAVGRPWMWTDRKRMSDRELRRNYRARTRRDLCAVQDRVPGRICRARSAPGRRHSPCLFWTATRVHWIGARQLPAKLGCALLLGTKPQARLGQYQQPRSPSRAAALPEDGLRSLFSAHRPY